MAVVRSDPLCGGVVLMDDRGVVVLRSQPKVAHAVARDQHVPEPEPLPRWQAVFSRKPPKRAPSIDAVDTSKKIRPRASEAQIGRLRVLHKQRYGTWPSRRTIKAWERLSPAAASRVIDAFQDAPKKRKAVPPRNRRLMEIANWAERQQSRRFQSALDDPRK